MFVPNNNLHGQQKHEYDKIDDNNPKSEAKEEESPIMYFEKIAVSLALMLDEIFPPSSGVKIIAEPGRYFVAACATLVASVISVRVNLTDDKTSEDEIITKYRTESCGGSKNSELQDNFAYYINDGVLAPSGITFSSTNQLPVLTNCVIRL